MKKRSLVLRMKKMNKNEEKASDESVPILEVKDMATSDLNDEAMKKVHKGITIHDIEKCALLLSTYGLSKYAIYSFIVGFPWEGKEDCLRTIDFAHSIVSKYGGAGLINWLYFFPGSEMWSQRQLYGLREGPERYDSTYYKRDELKTKSCKVEEADIIEAENYCTTHGLLARF